MYYPNLAPPSNQCVSSYDDTGDYLWVCGRWNWDAYTGWNWTDGHWEAVRYGQSYSPGYWYHSGSRYLWNPGNWIQASYGY